MSEVPPSVAAREAIRELGTAGKFPSVAWLHEKWDTVRDFMRGVRVVGVPALSVVFGFLMFCLVPQVQDLFLDVRNNGWGPLYWVGFYLSVLVAWVLPVYVSARWIMGKAMEGSVPKKQAGSVAPRVARLIPPFLAAACLVAVLAGQIIALEHLPEVKPEWCFDSGPVDQRWADYICSKDRPLYTAVLFMYSAAALSGGWLILGWKWFRSRSARAAWWAITLFFIYILRHFPHNIYDLFKALGKDPLNTGHLALLPLVSALTAWLIWRALSTPPRKDLVAPSPEGYTVSGPWAEFMPPLFYAVLAVSVAIIGLLLVLHPVTVTTYVYRALLLPFFLGILVPPFTWLSYLSQRWHAPLVLATVALLGIFSSTATNDIRTIPHPTVMKKLPSAAEEPLHSDNRAAEEWTVARAQWRGVWPGFLNRPAIYSTVERWAHVNECEFGFADPSRLQSKDEKERMLAEGERKKSDNCPRPILVSAAGGASRAAFLLDSLIGKLIDGNSGNVEAAREKISQSEQRVGSPKAGKLTADGSIPDSDAELELKKAEEELKVATLKVVLTMGGPGSSAGKTVSANFSPDGLYAVTAHKDERAPKRGTSYVWDLTRLHETEVGFTGDYPGNPELESNWLRARDKVLEQLKQKSEDANTGTVEYNARVCEQIKTEVNSLRSANNKPEWNWPKYPPLCVGHIRAEGAHSGTLYSAAFYGTPQAVLTASADRTARLWVLGAPQLKEPKGSVELKDHVDPEWPLNWQSAIKDPAIKDLQVQTRLGSLLVHDRPVVSVVRLPRLPDPVWDSKRWNDTRDTHGCMPTERTRFCDQGEPIDMSSRVVTMTDDGSIRVWAPAGAAEDISVPFGNFVWPNGTYTEWSGTDWWVVLHPERTLPPAKAQSKRVREGKELIASPDGRFIAALFDDEPAELISVQSGERVDWPGGKTPIAGTSPAFGLDAKNRLLFAYAYSEGSDSQGHIYVGDLSGQKAILEAADVRRLAFNRDATQIAAGFGDGSVRIWKIDQESLIASVRPHAKPVISIAFNPKYENQLLTLADDGIAVLWEPRSKQPRLRRFEQQLFSISGVSGGSLGAVIAYAALADAQLAQPDRSEGRLKPPCLKKPHDSEWFGSDQGQKKETAAESWQSCLELIAAGDFLSPVFASLLSTDLIGIQGRNGDRAAVLERAWEERYRQITDHGALAERRQ